MAEQQPEPGDEFKPGDVCNRPGIYRVVHGDEHTEEHEVTVVYHKRFPLCRQCGNHSRFTLVKLAQHIEDNEWFKKTD
jgi:hypothetical protein